MSKINLSTLPGSPGIYQFLDNSGKIIYIGKSVNLKSRVSSYFNGKSKLNFAKQKMVKQIVDLKYIIVNNERESLLLETTLIKKHKPKYNILMKDDKNHLYIKITTGDFPQIIKTRIKNKSGEYFGPYISSHYVDQILKFLKKHFGYGIGQHHFFDKKSSYNLDKYLFKGENTIIENNQALSGKYLEKIQEMKDFLKSDFKKVVSRLGEKMKLYAEQQRFEEAGSIKQSIDAISSLEVNQIARDGVNGDYDIIHYLSKYDSFYIGVIEIRDGKITGMSNYQVENKLEETEDEIIQAFLKSGPLEYVLSEKNISKPPILLLPKNISLEENVYKQVVIEVPKIGPKVELLKLCYKNIYEYAHKKHLASLSTKGFTKKDMLSLLNILSYKQVNKDILFECNDISHISGNHTVASRSIIENGKSNTSKYKKFKIKTLEEQKIDDFGSMKEITDRRVKEIIKSGYYPDLIIIDGGKGQLSSVVEIFQNSDLETMPQLVSIAKREEELFLPGQSESIILKKDSPELRMVQKIRDEAHRFAITFNRDKRIKAMKKNILESIPGIGPKTRKKILTKYGSVENLKEIKTEELVTALGSKVVESLEIHGIV